MDTISLTALRFKAQINKFSGIITKGFPKTKKRLVKEIIYGIQASKDVKLSNISRALNENIKLIKTEDRLSRNLAAFDFSEKINDQTLRLGASHIKPHMVIAIDPGDIAKPYAKDMEYLCAIYDGDKKTQATGYHLCQVTASTLEHDKIIPLYCKVYSTEELHRPTATQVIKETIDKVVNQIGTQGIWAIDRQGDNNEIIEHFDVNQLNFITRLKKDRGLRINDNLNNYSSAENLANHVKKFYTQEITKIEDGIETILTVEYGTIPVTLIDYPNIKLTAIVVKGFGKIPMVLITNKEIEKDNPMAEWMMVEAYLTRWKCDECFRYIKQSYNLEDIRVRSFSAICNMVALINAVAYFVSIYLGQSLKLSIMVKKIFIISKRFFAVPAFFHYAMADGIFEILKRIKKPFEDYVRSKCNLEMERQLSLFPT